MDSAYRQRLRQRLSRRFELHDEVIAVAGRQYQFTRVRDPEKVLDDVVAQEARGAAGRMPYWAELWESALGVGEWLAEFPISNGPLPIGNSGTSIGNRKLAIGDVLDLGCGMGFTGMVAASLGYRALLADIERDSLLFAALNCAPWRDRVRTRRVDWRSDQLGEKFDLVIGADVLYERAQWDYLEPFWRAHLSAAGRVVLGEPGRQTGEVFPEWIAARGWAIEIESVRLEERSKTISVFVLTV